MTRLSKTQIENLPDLLPRWAQLLGQPVLRREFRFADFSAAWGFMTRVALIAERLDHHPTWTNTHGRVEILLTTHDPAGLTTKDVAMARAIDALLA